MARIATPPALRRACMAHVARVIALAGVLVVAAPALAGAQSSTVDTATSQRLTDYLRKHRLPLVGAQITRESDGGTQVMLFGYVATSFGKNDAEIKARKFMKPGAQIINRIEIRPEILHLKSKKVPASGGATTPPYDQGGGSP